MHASCRYFAKRLSWCVRTFTSCETHLQLPGSVFLELNDSCLISINYLKSDLLRCPYTSAFSPISRLQLKSAVVACLKLSPSGECFDGPHGPIVGWDVSRAVDMSRMFSNAKNFDGDISKWDVSRAENMRGMFLGATSFNGDLTKWDVSSVKDMSDMFRGAKIFKRELCGAAWVYSKAKKTTMFAGSSGSISRDSCNGACESNQALYHLHARCQFCTWPSIQTSALNITQ